MIVVEQGAHVETQSLMGPSEAIEFIERIGRVSYKSEDKITNESAQRFVDMLLHNGHESVIEHVSFTARFVVDRGLSHEIVRHRLASFTQESTRYCNYGKKGGEIQVIEPPGLAPDARNIWAHAVEVAEKAYLDLLALGYKPQIARSVLPTCLKTELYMTANLREWRHVFSVRADKAAHPQLVSVMTDLLNDVRELFPGIFDDIPWE